MGIILIVIFVMCMFLWFFAAMPFPQTQPFGWTNNIFAWVAVAILGYVVLSGAPVRLSSVQRSSSAVDSAVYGPPPILFLTPSMQRVSVLKE